MYIKLNNLCLAVPNNLLQIGGYTCRLGKRQNHTVYLIQHPGVCSLTFASPRLSVLSVVIWWRSDCARDVPIVLVVAALQVQLTSFLWHNLLLRSAELTLIEVSALVIALVTATVIRFRKW
jgi:hypothetical protein